MDDEVEYLDPEREYPRWEIELLLDEIEAGEETDDTMKIWAEVSKGRFFKWVLKLGQERVLKNLWMESRAVYFATVFATHDLDLRRDLMEDLANYRDINGKTVFDYCQEYQLTDTLSVIDKLRE